MEIFEKIPGNIPEDSGKCLNRFQGIYLKRFKGVFKKILGKVPDDSNGCLKIFWGMF